jgi:hypothetical protein
MAKTFRRKCLRKTRSNKKSSCRNRKIKGGFKIPPVLFLLSLGFSSLTDARYVKKTQKYQLSEPMVKHSKQAKLTHNGVFYEGRFTNDGKFFFTKDKAFKAKVLKEGGNDPTADFTLGDKDVYIMGRLELCKLGFDIEYYEYLWSRTPTELSCDLKLNTEEQSEYDTLGYVHDTSLTDR